MSLMPIHMGSVRLATFCIPPSRNHLADFLQPVAIAIPASVACPASSSALCSYIGVGVGAQLPWMSPAPVVVKRSQPRAMERTIGRGCECMHRLLRSAL